MATILKFKNIAPLHDDLERERKRDEVTGHITNQHIIERARSLIRRKYILLERRKKIDEQIADIDFQVRAMAAD